METLKFKTSIKCSGCVEAVKPHLDKAEGVKEWSVDLDSPDKELTVETDGDRTAEVRKAMQEAGYEATPMS